MSCHIEKIWSSRSDMMGAIPTCGSDQKISITGGGTH